MERGRGESFIYLQNNLVIKIKRGVRMKINKVLAGFAGLVFLKAKEFARDVEANISPSRVIGLMIGLLVMAYTLPTAISTLSNTTVQGSPAVVALWGLLPLLAVIIVILWLVPRR